MNDTLFPDDDYFRATRMPLGGHLEELRLRLWRALIGFGLIVVLAFVLDGVGYFTGLPVGVGKPMLDLIQAPLRDELNAYHERRLRTLVRELEAGKAALVAADAPREFVLDVEMTGLARQLGLCLPPGEGAARYAPLRVKLSPLSLDLLLEEARLRSGRGRVTAMHIAEPMMVYLKVTLVCGVVLGSPWIFWQLWAFIGAGLYPHEKRLVHRALPLSLALFLGGVLLCQFVVMPRAVEALLGFNEWLGVEPELRLREWLNFALLMPLAFGLSFQTPLVMVLLARLGVMGADDFRAKRRAAWFVLAVFAAVVTPSPDVYSMLFLWVPMGLLYELGIWLCRRRPPGLPPEGE